MVDFVDRVTRSRMMQKVKSISKLEEMISKELWRRGLRMRRNVLDLYGKPDFSLKKYKIAIFIDSCFWHSCEQHGTVPQSNTQFWETKLNRNKLRDQEVTQYYVDKGWNILRIWEHELKQDWEGAINKIVTFVLQKSS
ncbi:MULTISPECIES: very short patch repair endonuclease [unclassified Paenibacillus]|uniref:very short patch repair endonuclease n=1 Tax=unclassified Paenibacillus TaxID=185978 RepID=UPI001AEB5887|nr:MULTISPECIES: very short patch repair endonuclease [unclassified Paenibacillus]MBP1157670.1 DNA mismatch endonuclease (patch repair protein) [Paenibacillus sp. PvP091]MBP1171593.1 DNA mismatch endonuclease (patch repair protein) [Paenibacillus sp. PvR098]MBP2437974.1 DNA mismatch endonuclease (patch repair protein) [Paenibacillus sp. PvP052]